MCTVKDSPGPRSTGPQLRVPAAKAQEGSVELSMDQEVPASVGSRSLTVTLRAVPVPPLVTTMENPMVSPAETLGASAVLAMSMAAARTSTEAEAESDPSLVVLTEAVLATGESACVLPVARPILCTVKDSPGPRSTGP